MEASTYHPMLNISVIPQVPYKLAPKVWKRMYKLDRAPFTHGGVSPVRTAGTSAGFLTVSFLTTVSIAVLTAVTSHLLVTSAAHFKPAPSNSLKKRRCASTACVSCGAADGCQADNCQAASCHSPSCTADSCSAADSSQAHGCSAAASCHELPLDQTTPSQISPLPLPMDSCTGQLRQLKLLPQLRTENISSQCDLAGSGNSGSTTTSSCVPHLSSSLSGNNQAVLQCNSSTITTSSR